MIGSALKDASIICRKDLRLEWRSKIALNHALPFVLAIVMLFAFALDVDSDTLVKATSGLFWVTVLFASNLLIQRSSSVEAQDGIGDALKLSGMSPAGMFLGKTAALFIQLIVIEAVLVTAVVVFYGIEITGVALLAAVVPLTTLSLAAAGSIYGPLAAGLSGRETVLPLLFLPVVAPVLLAATRASEVALERAVGGGWPWVAMLGMLSFMYLALGTLLWGPLLEET